MSQRHWARVLAANWAIDADLEPLAGEFDLNFRVIAHDGRRFVLKVMRANCDASLVDMMCSAHDYIHANADVHAGIHAGIHAVAHADASHIESSVPSVVSTTSGDRWCIALDTEGRERFVWLISFLRGRTYAQFQPRSAGLIRELGEQIAQLDRALAGFSHAAMQRDLKWDLLKADWIDAQSQQIADPERRAIVQRHSARYAALKPALLREPVAAIHNDLNDYNILVVHEPGAQPHISGLLDFGDIATGPAVVELAIAAAYVALDQLDPERAIAELVRGYNAVTPLTGVQLDLIWPLVLMRLSVSVTNSALMQLERPDDPYVVISEAPAWRLLERAEQIPAARVAARLRVACGFACGDSASRTLEWIEQARGQFAPVMGVDLGDVPVGPLSPIGCTIPRDPSRMTAAEALALGTDSDESDESDEARSTWIGRYREPRLIYTEQAFALGPHRGSDRRTVHIGVDIFMPPGASVHAPLDGTVEVVEYREQHLDYGGMVILRHTPADGVSFATIYGHLSHDSVSRLRVGQQLGMGEAFVELGDATENGGWDPHLHLQLALDADLLGNDWPGVADPDDLEYWCALCPNPAALLNLPDARIVYQPLDTTAIRSERSARFATNLRLSYADPCLFVRAWRTHMYDEWGRAYLDAYNNVPHVGHSHPRIAAVAQAQLRRVNTNTRYLQPELMEFADTLLAKAPPQMTHVFFVNSGSEGNELALRLARAHTGGKDMVVVDHAYHGNTTGAIDLSPYKFNKPNGGGAPEWVQVVPVADVYRGEHRGDDAAERYASAVDGAIDRIRARGGRLAGFIAETFPSVGGQIIPPEGYLPAVYARARAAGGVCIADEVQTGLGRLGEFYWGFEQQRANPDIIVLGKPLGNGYPLGAVMTTTEIAQSFDNGIEYFSTFGGSTLSCRIGTEVLRIVDEEGLQANARAVGGYLLQGLRDLRHRHDVIGDVRGVGLFVGVDLVSDRVTRAPASDVADYVKNRMREQRILVGTEGPADNILKLRPPLTVTLDDVDQLLATLDHVLGETAAHR